MVGTPKAKNEQGGFEFFIVSSQITDLNEKLSVFGRVVKGQDVVKEIEEVEIDEHYQPKAPIEIMSVTLLQDMWNLLYYFFVLKKNSKVILDVLMLCNLNTFHHLICNFVVTQVLSFYLLYNSLVASKQHVWHLKDIRELKQKGIANVFYTWWYKEDTVKNTWNQLSQPDLLFLSLGRSSELQQ